MKRLSTFSGALMVWLTIAGCGGPPQVSPGNYRLIGALRTATSSKQLEWINQSAEQLEEAKANAAVTEAEYKEFQSIICLARDGKWKEAEAKTIRLGKAQKPGSKEIDRSRGSEKAPGGCHGAGSGATINPVVETFLRTADSRATSPAHDR